MNTDLTSPYISLLGVWAKTSCMASRCLNGTLRPMKRNRNTEMVMRPRPPSWIKNRTTVWPNMLKWLPVSTTTRPVTHTALVAVNKASMGLMPLPVALTGRASKTAPTKIVRQKLISMSAAGLALCNFFTGFCTMDHVPAHNGPKTRAPWAKAVRRVLIFVTGRRELSVGGVRPLCNVFRPPCLIIAPLAVSASAGFQVVGQAGRRPGKRPGLIRHGQAPGKQAAGQNKSGGRA